MTRRAVFFGLLGAVFIAVAGYMNDSYIRVALAIGNHFPPIVFGLLILLALGINPILYRIRPQWRFRTSELAVIIALTLAACSIPSAGLMRGFVDAISMPIQYNRTEPGWQKAEILDYAPPQMLVAGGEYRPEVIEGLVSGMGSQGEPIGLTDVPWRHWQAPLLTWVPLILLLHLGLICLGLIVHRQWSSRERLRYPVANFAIMLMQTEPGRAFGKIFSNKLFWVGFGIVLFIRVVNGAHVWFPALPEIPLKFDFGVIHDKYEFLRGRWLRPALYPAVIAFAFFLASDVGFTLGVSDFLYGLVVSAMLAAGVDTSGNYMTGSVKGWHVFGSYVGFTLMLIYTGRHYYWHVLRGAVTFRLQEDVEPSSAWACRIFLMSMLATIALFTVHGLEWPLATALVALMVMMFLVISRVNVECGLFFYKPTWQPPGVLIGLFGLSVLGPKAIIVIGLLTMVLSIDPKECFMPFLMNGLKMTDDTGTRPSRTGWAVAAAFALGLAVVMPVALWASYNNGLQFEDGFSNRWIPSAPFKVGLQSVTQLSLAGELETVEQYSPWERIMRMDPEQRFLWAAGIGFVLILLCSICRLRFSWWPLHPVLFLVVGMWAVAILSVSFFLGWLIKVMVVRFGGGSVYKKVIPLMVGVIAADVTAAVVFTIIGTAYFGVTGLKPPQYFIFQ